MGDRPVLVMTAEHKAFPLKPVRIPGEVMGLHFSDGAKYGFKFSGEKVTVHIPLTEPAVQELRETTPTEVRTSDICNWSSKELVQLAVQKGTFELSLLDQMALGVPCLGEYSLPALADGSAPLDQSLEILSLAEPLSDILGQNGIQTVDELISYLLATR
jgi:hypothetical protein